MYVISDTCRHRIEFLLIIRFLLFWETFRKRLVNLNYSGKKTNARYSHPKHHVCILMPLDEHLMMNGTFRNIGISRKDEGYEVSILPFVAPTNISINVYTALNTKEFLHRGFNIPPSSNQKVHISKSRFSQGQYMGNVCNISFGPWPHQFNTIAYMVCSLKEGNSLICPSHNQKALIFIALYLWRSKI